MIVWGYQMNSYIGIKHTISSDSDQDLLDGLAKLKSLMIWEEKYDGIFCTVVVKEDSVDLISRTGKLKENDDLQSLRDYILKVFPAGTILTGELAFGSQSATKLYKELGHRSIVIFDIIQYEGKSFAGSCDVLSRKRMLLEVFARVNPNSEWVSLSEFTIFNMSGTSHRAEVLDWYKEVIAKGGEGLVGKIATDTFSKFGEKNPNYYRIKKHVTMDYIITGFTVSKSSDYQLKGYVGGVIGSLLTEDSKVTKKDKIVTECTVTDGKNLTSIASPIKVPEGFKLIEKVTIGSMDDSNREIFCSNGKAFLGEVMECAGFELFTSGSLRHPSFVRLRPDKKMEECVFEPEE